MKKALITGITGQDGVYLTAFLLGKGYEVSGISRQSNPDIDKLVFLGVADKVRIFECNMTDEKRLREVIEQVRPDEIYNFAGQSSVEKSIASPDETLKFNTTSFLNLIEVIKTINPKIKVYQASTSEMYGPKTSMPITEDSPIDPVNPYGVSKAASFLAAKRHRAEDGLFIVNGIAFNHESHLRDARYFIRNLIITAISISKGKDEYVYVGQADNLRDFGYAPAYVEAMWLSLQAEKPSDYVICSGKPVSIRSITEYVLNKFRIPLDRIKIDPKLFRTPNVPAVFGDPSRARRELGWKYDKTFYEVLDMMVEQEIIAYGKKY